MLCHVLLDNKAILIRARANRETDAIRLCGLCWDKSFSERVEKDLANERVRIHLFAAALPLQVNRSPLPRGRN
jgi:hypothetical protein